MRHENKHFYHLIFLSNLSAKVLNLNITCFIDKSTKFTQMEEDLQLHTDQFFTTSATLSESPSCSKLKDIILTSGLISIYLALSPGNDVVSCVQANRL